MDAKKNPFIFAGATELTSDMILDYYIEDFNYSRFIQTKRNIFLVGERVWQVYGSSLQWLASAKTKGQA